MEIFKLITEEMSEKIKQKIQEERWFVEVKDNSEIINLRNFFNRINKHIPEVYEAKGFTNVDMRGNKYNNIMWSRGGISPNCVVYTVDSFLAKFLYDHLKTTSEEIKEKTNKIKEIDAEFDKIMKKIKKLEKEVIENHKKKINLVLDEIREKIV